MMPGTYQNFIEMAKLQREVSGATQVQEHADNEGRSVDEADWTVQPYIYSYSEDNRITS